MKREKEKKNAEDYLGWAGWFQNPETDPGVFSRLPGWWQRERVFIRDAVASGRSFTLAELQQIHLVQPEPQIRCTIPDHMARETLERALPRTLAMSVAVKQLEGLVTVASVQEHCTAFGEGRHLLRERPVHGFYGYLWALALYRRGITASLSLSAFYELEEGVLLLTGRPIEYRPHPPFDAWVNCQVDSLLSSVA